MKKEGRRCTMFWEMQRWKHTSNTRIFVIKRANKCKPRLFFSDDVSNKVREMRERFE